MKTMRVNISRLFGLHDCASGFQCTVNDFIRLLDYVDTNPDIFPKGTYGFNHKGLNTYDKATSVIRTEYDRERVYELCEGLQYKRSIDVAYVHKRINSNMHSDLLAIAEGLGITVNLVSMYLDVISPNLTCPRVQDIVEYDHTPTQIKCKVKRNYDNMQHSARHFRGQKGKVAREYSNLYEKTIEQLIDGYLYSNALSKDKYDIVINTVMWKCGCTSKEAQQAFITGGIPPAVREDDYMIPEYDVTVTKHKVSTEFVQVFNEQGVDMFLDRVANMAITTTQEDLTFELTIEQQVVLSKLWLFSTRETQVDFLCDIAYLDYEDNVSDVANPEHIGVDATHTAIDTDMRDSYLLYWHEIQETL